LRAAYPEEPVSLRTHGVIVMDTWPGDDGGKGKPLSPSLLTSAAKKAAFKLRHGGCIIRLDRRMIMKLALIALGLLATTGVVYAACVFC
jgi:hypothetical protein